MQIRETASRVRVAFAANSPDADLLRNLIRSLSILNALQIRSETRSSQQREDDDKYMGRHHPDHPAAGVMNKMGYIAAWEMRGRNQCS